MSSEKYLVIVILALASLLVVAGAPSTMNLQDAIDKSVCKTEVYRNIDENRIPQVIKELKCAAQPDALCPASNEYCCGAGSGLQQLSCVEVKDYVRVQYNNHDFQNIKVAVGCSCISESSMEAKLIPAHPGD